MFSDEYVAGFFDGEGCIRVARNGQRGFTLSLQVGQNVSPLSTELFTFIQARYGGGLSTQRSLSGRMKYNLQLSGRDAEKFLMRVGPRLFLKKEQALLALRWYQDREPVARDERGRITARPDSDMKKSLEVTRQLAEMKKT